MVLLNQNIQQQTFYSTNISYKIPFYNPVKIIFWKAQLVSNYNANDLFNYTASPYTDLLSNVSDNIIKNDENLVNNCIRIIIENKKYEMANQLLNDLV